METITTINITFQVWSAILCLLIVIGVRLTSFEKGTAEYIYSTLLVCNIGALLGDAMTAFLAYGGHNYAHVGMQLTLFLEFFFQGSIVPLFICFMKAYFEQHRPNKLNPIYNWVAAATFIGNTVLFLVNVKWPFMFTVIGTQYMRLPAFPLAGWFPLLGAIGSCIMLSRNFNILEKWEKVFFTTIYILPFISGILSTLIHGLNYFQIGITVALISISLGVQVNKGVRIAEREKTMLRSNVAILLSQIQPHFLFNALNSIEYLCESGSEDAGKAVNHLAAFLRQNMDSISEESCVPFERELEHVKNYLYIEQFRFPHIDVHYNLATVDFDIPSLTVQPMVENAVKHGLRNKRNDAYIGIATSEDKKGYYVTVSDNGCGFDEKKVKSDGKVHIGIDNVRDRLALMCKGTLTVSSNDKGTIVIIFIPKNSET